MAELTATSKIYSLPQEHLHGCELTFGAIYTMNIVAVKASVKRNFWFALIKIVAIVAMIVTVSSWLLAMSGWAGGDLTINLVVTWFSG